MIKFFKKLSIIFIVLFFAVCAYADTALQVDFLLAGYRHPTSDAVLSGGKVYSYLDGTSTLSALWTDKDKGGAAANPVILDSSGKAEVFGDNIYKFLIYDSDDVLIETLNGLSYEIEGSNNFFPDYSAADQGVTGSNNTLKYYIDTIGSDNATIVLRHNSGAATTTYTLATDETIPSNITLQIERGAVIDGVAGGGVESLVVNGQFNPGLYTVFGTNLTVTFGDGFVYEWFPQWWGALADGATDDYSAITACITAAGAGGVVTFPRGVYVVTDTPTMAVEQTWRGIATGFDAASATLNTRGSWIKQTGAGKNGVFIGIAGAAGANGEIDGWIVENLIVSTNTNGNHGVVVNNALRGVMRNVFIPGAAEDGFHTTNYCFLNKFDNVRVISGASTGLGQVKNGFVLDSGPNSFYACGASGIATGTGYGWHLNGESSSLFLNCESEGNKYGVYFAGAAAYNVFIPGMIMEANTTADVGGSSTTPRNMSIGYYNPTNSMSLGSTRGNNLFPIIPASGEVGIYIDRLYAGNSSFSYGAGITHLAGSSTDVCTASTGDNIPNAFPVALENVHNTADATVLTLMNRQATPTGFAKFGFNAGALSIQSRNINTGTARRIRLNPSGGGASIGLGGVPVHANNAAAIAGGLVAGDLYRTGADPDPLFIVH